MPAPSTALLTGRKTPFFLSCNQQASYPHPPQSRHAAWARGHLTPCFFHPPRQAGSLRKCQRQGPHTLRDAQVERCGIAFIIGGRAHYRLHMYGHGLGSRWAIASVVATLHPCQERMRCNTHLEELLRPDRQPQSPRTLPQNPQGLHAAPFSDGIISLWPIAACYRQATTMLPPCMHPIAPPGIVGLARPSTREPHLRARHPTRRSARVAAR